MYPFCTSQSGKFFIRVESFGPDRTSRSRSSAALGRTIGVEMARTPEDSSNKPQELHVRGASFAANPLGSEGMRTEVPSELPTEVTVKRSDPIYNAHAYLTKIPFSAIVPFIEALTKPGDRVLDVFAGSGMSGVAAAITGRRAELRDISVLGRHIGTNYMRLLDPEAIHEAHTDVVRWATKRLDDVYATRCAGCGEVGTLSKTVWSFQYECPQCREPVLYYEAFKASGWRKKSMKCATCGEGFRPRNARRIAEVPVLDYVRCDCSGKLQEQPHVRPQTPASLEGLSYPDAEIGAHRQMFQASALEKHGLLTTSAFFSERNLAVLSALHEGIATVDDPGVREKLTFAFTAILTRASKRYQWHPKRPLNASNQNYYIAPVFYEWNVYELFNRKVKACIRSDEFIRKHMILRGVEEPPAVTYKNSSAEALDLARGSVDYVFTDPPFGSNIFYSDMNLFQEAWLGDITDDTREAVVDRSDNGKTRRSAERYEQLIVRALKECHRVLKSDGWLSLVFSNSNGAMWLLVQRAIHAAGFVLEHVTLLDKGQRSVKGLASGFEGVVTSDLILTMRKATAGDIRGLGDAPSGALHIAIEEALEQSGVLSPTKVYLWIITKYLRNEWKVSGITIGGIQDDLRARGYDLDPATGELTIGSTIAA
jgi:DNA modification methylase